MWGADGAWPGHMGGRQPSTEAASPPAPSSFPPPRYAIDRSTDLEWIFDIDPESGAITTCQGLDREAAGWHNITVLAMEAGELTGLTGSLPAGSMEGAAGPAGNCWWEWGPPAWGDHATALPHLWGLCSCLWLWA